MKQYSHLQFLFLFQGGPGSANSKTRAVSFALEVSTIPADPSSSLSSVSQTTEESRDSPRATKGSRDSSRTTLTTLGSTIAGSEDLTTVSKDFLSVSTCDEVRTCI